VLYNNLIKLYWYKIVIIIKLYWYKIVIITIKLYLFTIM